jgi:hypothetical protein
METNSPDSPVKGWKPLELGKKPDGVQMNPVTPPGWKQLDGEEESQLKTMAEGVVTGWRPLDIDEKPNGVQMNPNTPSEWKQLDTEE